MNEIDQHDQDERDISHLSDWTVRLALVTILLLGVVVLLTTGSAGSQGWQTADHNAISVSAERD